MKCLCFSDSHGVSGYMRAALARHSDAEVVFFLGDGLSDAEIALKNYPNMARLVVRGNCDTLGFFESSVAEKTGSITLEGKRIVYTHGDLYGAKYGFDGLIRLAEEREADVVLYGHTHYALEKYISLEKRGVYLFNPGTVGGVFYAPSYGVLNIDKGNISFSIMNFEDL